MTKSETKKVNPEELVPMVENGIEIELDNLVTESGELQVETLPPLEDDEEPEELNILDEEPVDIIQDEVFEEAQEAEEAAQKTKKKAPKATKAKAETALAAPKKKKKVPLTNIKANLDNIKLRPGRFAFRGNEDATITDDGDRNFVPQYEQENLRAKEEAIYSANTGYVLKGEVKSVSQHKLNGQTFYSAMINYGEINVLIPYEKFHQTTKPSEAQDERYQRSMIDKRLKAEVDFVIEELDLAHNVAIGNRLKAMEIKRARYWFGKNTLTGEYLLQPGTRVMAKVVALSNVGVFLESFGLEFFVPVSEMSYQRIVVKECGLEVGDKVVVRLLDISRIEEGYKVRISASIKQAKPDPRDRAMRVYNVGNACAGVVTHINSATNNGGIYVNIEPGVDVFCNWKAGILPQTGDKVTINITNKDLKMKRLYGNIVHVAKKPTRFL